jgi:hypothetical protein
LIFKCYFQHFDRTPEAIAAFWRFLKSRAPAQSGLCSMQIIRCGAANDRVAERLLLGLNLM